MATILSIADIIEVGKASTYLSANYVSRGSLFGTRIIKPNLPVQIAFVTDALEWGNDGGAETDASLRTTANYLYWLCNKFQLEAQNIINGAGGGSVVPSGGGSSVTLNPLQFIVAASGTTMVDGESSVTLTDFISYNIIFSRNGIPQSTVTTEASYYLWNKVTGLLTISPAANTGELFQIFPL